MLGNLPNCLIALRSIEHHFVAHFDIKLWQVLASKCQTLEPRQRVGDNIDVASCLDLKQLSIQRTENECELFSRIINPGFGSEIRTKRLARCTMLFPEFRHWRDSN